MIILQRPVNSEHRIIVFIEMSPFAWNTNLAYINQWQLHFRLKCIAYQKLRGGETCAQRNVKPASCRIVSYLQFFIEFYELKGKLKGRIRRDSLLFKMLVAISLRCVNRSRNLTIYRLWVKTDAAEREIFVHKFGNTISCVRFESQLTASVVLEWHCVVWFCLPQWTCYRFRHGHATGRNWPTTLSHTMTKRWSPSAGQPDKRVSSTETAVKSWNV